MQSLFQSAVRLLQYNKRYSSCLRTLPTWLWPLKTAAAFTSRSLEVIKLLHNSTPKSKMGQSSVGLPGACRVGRGKHWYETTGTQTNQQQGLRDLCLSSSGAKHLAKARELLYQSLQERIPTPTWIFQLIFMVLGESLLFVLKDVRFILRQRCSRKLNKLLLQKLSFLRVFWMQQKVKKHVTRSG